MNFDYNTQRKRMALPEYGRNVQKMVDYVKTIEDREEKTVAAKTVVQVMANLNTAHFRDDSDFQHKLWDHLTLMADFDLDVDAPYPMLEPKDFEEKPNTIPYNQGNVRYLHYGRVIEMMIKKVTDMEDGEKKDYFTNLIANQMKRSYITWNRGQVSDEVILSDMVKISGGKLKITDAVKIMEVKEPAPSNKKKPQQNKNYGKQNKQYNNKKKAYRH